MYAYMFIYVYITYFYILILNKTYPADKTISKVEMSQAKFYLCLFYLQYKLQNLIEINNLISILNILPFLTVRTFV